MNLGRESEQVEFKKSTSELKEGVESVASILNKHGSGVLYFGVRKDGEVVGQDVAESTLRQVSQAICDSVEPRIAPTVEALSDERGREYVKVSFSGSEAPYACKGTYRIRVADEDKVMTSSQIESMLTVRMEARAPWDSRPSARPFGDVDVGALRAYVERGFARGRIPFEFTDVRDVLDRLGLLAGGRLTNAAEALFCPSSEVQLKMGLLATHARTEILDLRQEEGTVFSLVDAACAYVLTNLRRRIVINDRGPRDEVPEIPPKAVKEALMNAYAHRDWAKGGCVQVDIFPDSVEVLSPGWFVEGQDPAEHLSGASTSSKTRNALMAKALFRSGDMESYGTGIPRIRDLCAEVGVRVGYERTPDGTKLVFHRNDAFAVARQQSASNPPAIRQQSADGAPEAAGSEKAAWEGLCESDRRVWAYLAREGESKASAISDGLAMKRRTVGDALRRLSRKGLVEPRGESVRRTYRPARRPPGA